MDSLKKKAIEISNKFQFSPFQSAALAHNSGQDKAEGVLSSCDNHLDVEFMKLLDQGAHLDIKRMPL